MLLRRQPAGIGKCFNPVIDNRDRNFPDLAESIVYPFWVGRRFLERFELFSLIRRILDGSSLSMRLWRILFFRLISPYLPNLPAMDNLPDDLMMGLER
jgi:hypothetical protein